MKNMVNLEQRITNRFERLSPKQKRLARFALDNKHFLSFASTSQTANKTGTSAASVVRFARALGYTGFTEMQSDIRSEIPGYQSAVERMQARLRRLPEEAETPDRIFAMDIHNLERTAHKLTREKLEQAIQTILKANTILVVGSGLSAGSALTLAHSLRVIGFDARPSLSGGLPLALDIAQLQPGSLVIAIDLRRNFRATVQAISAAREAGIPTIAITDSIVSPLAEMADHAFEIITESAYNSTSPTALVAFLNVLVTMLTDRIPEKALESLRHVEAAYRSSGLLYQE